MGFLSKIVDGNKKEIKRLGKLADKVLALEEDTAMKKYVKKQNLFKKS